MQIINLMQFLMRQLNVDLKLTMYEIMAYSSKDGVMEFVSHSHTLQHIRQVYNDDIVKFLSKISREKSKSHGEDAEFMSASGRLKDVRKDVFENYKESCASYVVITYLLGIGDRHLENLMMDEQGKLFHIDFGFSMGEDPKPMQPPIKLNRQMVAVFGDEYQKDFISRCVTYYLYLRKKSKVLLNLLLLMCDSNLVINPNK